MTETRLQTAILTYLAIRGIFADRINNGGVYDQKRGAYRRKGKYDLAGSPDIIICHLGQYIALEVKIGKGRQSDAQKAYEELVNEAGGQYHVVRSVQEVKELFK